MSEELKQPEAPKAKQYLLMVDEMNLALLGRVIPGLQFVQVEGFNMDSSKTHMALVTPKPAPQPEAVPASEAPKVD